MKEKYRADFLWPHDKESIEEAGYEFANGLTEAYRKQWWGILLERASTIAQHAKGVPVPGTKEFDSQTAAFEKWFADQEKGYSAELWERIKLVRGLMRTCWSAAAASPVCLLVAQNCPLKKEARFE